MKCPICGQQLRPGKKDPNYLLCYNWKKKFKVPQQNKEAEPEQKYSNIPPKKVREKRETEMRKAYDDLLSIEDEKKKKKANPCNCNRCSSRSDCLYVIKVKDIGQRCEKTSLSFFCAKSGGM